MSSDKHKKHPQAPASFSGDYTGLLASVKERIRSAQYAALKAVNTELVGLYWDIGQMIVERQMENKGEKSVVEQLSQDLQQEFPGIRGFSVQNLWYMRQFYKEYHGHEKLQPLVGEIGWAHNLAIMSKCKDALEREFYIRMTRKFGWSRNVLIHQIENQSYEKSLTGQTNFEQALTPELRAQAKLAVKDEYTFDFLELGQEHSERELERALIAKIEDFLRTMVACSPSWAVNTVLRWTRRSTSSICCCSIVSCDVWWPLNLRSVSSNPSLLARCSFI